MIYLVRHGETNWNRLKMWQGNSDIPLNEFGCRQAEATAKVFENCVIDAVYSSPLSRAYETAEIIANSLNLELTVIDNLREGKIELWNGKKTEEVLSKFKNEFEKWQTDPYAEINGLESLAEVQLRAVKTFKKIVTRHREDSNIVIVTHALWLKTLICWLLKMPVTENKRFKIDNASINKVMFDGKEFYLVSLNETWHLKVLDESQRLSGGVKYGES